MSRTLVDSFFHLALRTAIAGGLSSGLLSVAILYLVVGSWSLTILWGALAFTLLTAVAVYVIVDRYQRKRLNTLHRITRNIARKRFEDYENLATAHRDEVDYLIKQSVRASKMVEREIQRLNRIENYRKEFIGDISHELKTPIFAIQGFIETLLNGAIHDDEVNEKFLKKAMRNVNRLIYLTKDLMEISKLETGELKSEIQIINLREVVLDVIESLQYKAQKENVEIIYHDFDSSIEVQADRNQIKQVLINLIENGIKYNKKDGKVTVGLKSYPRDRQKVMLYIRDTGIGIDPKHVQRVTERFFRVDKSRSREKGGTGLGLSIVKHIMEAHDEEFFIDSEPNVGSEFSFTLTRSDGASL